MRVRDPQDLRGLLVPVERGQVGSVGFRVVRGRVQSLQKATFPSLEQTR